MGWRGPMSYRQFLTWSAWLTLDLDKPGKTEHYLAQIAFTVRQSAAAKPENVKRDEFLMTFQTPFKKLEESSPQETIEEISRRAKQRSLGRMMGQVRFVKKQPGDGDE